MTDSQSGYDVLCPDGHITNRVYLLHKGNKNPQRLNPVFYCITCNKFYKLKPEQLEII